MLRVIFCTAVEAELSSLSRAAHSLAEGGGPSVEVVARSRTQLEAPGAVAELAAAVPGSHLMIVRLMGDPESLPGFGELRRVAQEARVPLAVIPSSGEDLPGVMALGSLPAEDYERVAGYVLYGGETNFRQLLLWAANRFLGAAHAVEEPRPRPWEGLYHPDFAEEAAVAAYLEERRQKVSGPVVGVLFYQTWWLAGNTEFVDALIREIEDQGGTAVPVFLYSARNDELGCRGIEWAVEHYFMREGRPLVDAVITALMFSQTVASSSGARPAAPENLYQKLGVPLIKALVCLSSQVEWEQSLQGLGPLEVVMGVALPEFDGALITVPIAFREVKEFDPLTGAALTGYLPEPERVRKVASLALRWARLCRKPNSDKKVAVILHNYPPRNDRIGCAFGLDTPASLYRLLAALREKGYRVEDLPPDGAALMERILAGLTNERGWLDPREIERRAVAGVEEGVYTTWFSGFPVRSREHLLRDWGPPPGRVFAYGNRLLVPGIVLGNVFVGIQPVRGFLEDPSRIYHSPDLSPPHHYLAYYRWLRDEFGADLVFHLGKHGSLEWLPGKGIGLSAACFPDLALPDLPHVYPYIVNDPGEGTQAKRRTHAAIVDHLIPVMIRADVYDELAEVEALVREYHTAKTLDPAKLPTLREMIWKVVETARLDRDLNLTREEAAQDWEGFLERLHTYLFEVKDTLIREGLHVLGRPPEGEKLVDMLLALTRLGNASAPSLREEVARFRGLNYAALAERPGRFLPEFGRTGAEVLEEVDRTARDLLVAFASEGYRPERAAKAVKQVLGREEEGLSRVLEFVGETLVPRLAATERELGSCVAALEGGYVPPGPSGAPTRGRPEVLPTGRNFYSVDPQALPTSTAWHTGRALAEALLTRYREEEGKYPESVGMIIWATNTMRTGGEDLAEALYLLGVRPVWEKGGRVKGLEVIPLGELGRPRIDVTVRASGLFRDVFLNLVHLLDQAVELVASLDEPPDRNYVAAHVRSEAEELTRQGAGPAEARAQAMWRVFSDPPGTYGAGVSELITAKNWKDERDLAEVYVTWGGYAYGRGLYGREARSVFRRRLAALEATVKNEDTREIDIYDSDDFYSYHGGMVAAVKALRGSAPRSFGGDSSDPTRVKVRTLAEETRHIFRSRVLNPKWIESMKRHGYKGAGDLSHLVEIAFGWDATAEVLEDWLYQALAERYALDPEMQQWFKEVNPWALENIVAHLLEAIERGMWKAERETAEALKQVYLEVEAELEARTGEN
ncbi:MAG: cobaltochelatase subunit CobN [Clostridia bacterium]|nr:cobaltochelatase subunit CobN [Clostridia bacterium]MDH7573947.1 cobaltochelatase subunit CobN [Clostridia bacterium]